MSQLNYSMQDYDEKRMARARLNNAPLSRKIAVEIFDMIRYKSVDKAKMLLEEVLDMKRAVAYKKFNNAVAHRTGIGPGRYPIKAVQEVLTLIKLAEANAMNKGLGQKLILKHLAANKGSTQWHHGRQSRRQVKATHIEVVICEREAKNSETKTHTKQSLNEQKSQEKKVDVQEHKEEKTKTEDKASKPKKAKAVKSESKPKANKEDKE